MRARVITYDRCPGLAGLVDLMGAKALIALVIGPNRDQIDQIGRPKPGRDAKSPIHAKGEWVRVG